MDDGFCINRTNPAATRFTSGLFLWATVSGSVSTDGGIQPRWARNGKGLFYVALDGRLMAVPISVRGNALEPGTPVALFRPHIWNVTGPFWSQYDVAPDGRFLVLAPVEEDSATPITLLQNWKAPGK